MLGIFAAHLCDRGGDDDLPFQERLLEGLCGDRMACDRQQRHRCASAAALHADGSVDRARAPGGVSAFACRKLGGVARRRAVATGACSGRLAKPARCSSAVVVAALGGAERSAVWRAVAAATEARVRRPRGPKLLLTTLPRLSAKIASALANSSLRDWLRDARRSSSSSAAGLAWDDMLDLTPAEAAVARALYPIAADETKQNRLEGTREKYPARQFAVSRRSDSDVQGARASTDNGRTGGRQSWQPSSDPKRPISISNSESEQWRGLN